MGGRGREREGAGGTHDEQVAALGALDGGLRAVGDLDSAALLAVHQVMRDPGK